MKKPPGGGSETRKPARRRVLCSGQMSLRPGVDSVVNHQHEHGDNRRVVVSINARLVQCCFCNVMQRALCQVDSMNDIVQDRRYIVKDWCFSGRNSAHARIVIPCFANCNIIVNPICALILRFGNSFSINFLDIGLIWRVENTGFFAFFATFSWPQAKNRHRHRPITDTTDSNRSRIKHG